jgi:TatD DNase family protein
MYIDTHCHLNFHAFKNDVDEVIKRAKKAGVTKFIVPGADLSSSEKAVILAHQYPEIYAAVGIHPHHTQKLASQTTNYYRQALSRLKELAMDKRVVAIGEIGLDYHIYKGSEGMSPKEKQRELFLEQLEIAHELSLPVILHCREAFNDLFSVLPDQNIGVLHCFTGGLFHLKTALRLGLSIGFDGNVTYDHSLLEAVTNTPIDKLLLETDSPYLTPEPLRGNQNEPKNLLYTAKFIAKIRKQTVSFIEETTYNNSKTLFRI